VGGSKIGGGRVPVKLDGVIGCGAREFCGRAI
jgi:hypothetical protein